jgi:hypothetical protein
MHFSSFYREHLAEAERRAEDGRSGGDFYNTQTSDLGGDSPLFARALKDEEAPKFGIQNSEFRIRSKDVQPASGGANRALVVRDQEIEEAPVRQVQGELRCALVKPGDLQIVECRNASLDVKTRTNGFVVRVQEAPVHRQVVLHAAELDRSLEHDALIHGLFD